MFQLYLIRKYICEGILKKKKRLTTVKQIANVIFNLSVYIIAKCGYEAITSESWAFSGGYVYYPGFVIY